MAKNAKQIFGIELVQSAVDDAIKNANLNNIKNAQFVCGKAEVVTKEVIEKNNLDKEKNLVAVVDPPRPGLRMLFFKKKQHTNNFVNR